MRLEREHAPETEIALPIPYFVCVSLAKSSTRNISVSLESVSEYSAVKITACKAQTSDTIASNSGWK